MNFLSNRDEMAFEFAKILLESNLKHTRIDLVDRIKYFFNIKGWTFYYDYNSKNIAKESYKMADDLIRNRFK